MVCPAADELRLIGVATHLAALAIERTRREAELSRHRDHLQELVVIRTADLSRAQEELVRREKLAALGALVASFRQVAVDRSSSERRPFVLGALVDELLPPLRILARHREVAIRAEVAPGLAMDSYPGPLAEVLTHLVDNCLVHAFADDARGAIVIGASAGPQASVVVSVADNGAGIAPPLMPRVYDPFVTTRPGTGGSGLGLHVAHNIVSGVLGGTIELDSELGKGSTFRLRLPAIAPAMNGQDSG
ncbi:sensor histidine kinase [Massilia pseudoviolaceinigra]|uniref:sensor histidine kinase n=1 Tax=Massilia pseudoviolaceinigra TaxID=3057165 RepID=UPI002796A218|nr:ATP-binding protein [Massilia sp. CCM 9206]MDQ1924783.1 ATP-binding protein [Massilia sp. CCM 9206]